MSGFKTPCSTNSTHSAKSIAIPFINIGGARVRVTSLQDFENPATPPVDTLFMSTDGLPSLTHYRATVS